MNSVLHDQLCRSCSFCAKLDQLCEQGQNSLMLKPQTQQVWRGSMDFISNTSKPPKKDRCAGSNHILTSPASFPECCDLVHVLSQSHFDGLVCATPSSSSTHVSNALFVACSVERWLQSHPLCAQSRFTNLARCPKCDSYLHRLRAICFF
jgi:hypothetical protein